MTDIDIKVMIQVIKNNNLLDEFNELIWEEDNLYVLLIKMIEFHHLVGDYESLIRKELFGLSCCLHCGYDGWQIFEYNDLNAWICGHCGILLNKEHYKPRLRIIWVNVRYPGRSKSIR